MIPAIDGYVLHFEYTGLYNGLALIGDRETRSFWSHYTGECVHGFHRGKQLEVYSTIQHMHAEAALARYPHADLALANPRLFARFFSQLMKLTTLKPKGAIPPHFYRTMEPADERRPRLDLGLGVRIGSSARYYPLDILTASEPILDVLAGERLVLYVDPESGVPNAVAIGPGISGVEWHGDELLLHGTQQVLRGGNLHRPDGSFVRTERPFQQFTRWYGFSYTFPNCDIFSVRG